MLGKNRNKVFFSHTMSMQNIGIRLDLKVKNINLRNVAKGCFYKKKTIFGMNQFV